MTSITDFSIASSEAIETALGVRLERIRLSRNITQKTLAEEAGVGLRTLRRLEKGEGVSLDTFIRIMIALDIQPNLETLLPDTSVRPIERVARGGHERQRARPSADTGSLTPWAWDDEGSDNDN